MWRTPAHATENTLSVVIVGLVPAIQRATEQIPALWILGARPRMTPMGVVTPFALFHPAMTAEGMPPYFSLLAFPDAATRRSGTQYAGTSRITPVRRWLLDPCLRREGNERMQPTLSLNRTGIGPSQDIENTPTACE
ncbi:hypothetical protein DYI23_06275 [Roseibium polysiphoniae]|uniref:Uncharacterized protein n=1 Tax=Roseibium polysiphoniae TaxID=2571221 RepID=A0A944CC75_9HYPH|nr:hypothetical protein [Roseibium polysiphoniae]